MPGESDHNDVRRAVANGAEGNTANADQQQQPVTFFIFSTISFLKCISYNFQ